MGNSQHSACSISHCLGRSGDSGCFSKQLLQLTPVVDSCFLLLRWPPIPKLLLITSCSNPQASELGSHFLSKYSLDQCSQYHLCAMASKFIFQIWTSPSIYIFGEENHIKLNTTKTKLLIFFSKPVLPPLPSSCQSMATVVLPLFRFKTLASPLINLSHPLWI